MVFVTDESVLVCGHHYRGSTVILNPKFIEHGGAMAIYSYTHLVEVVVYVNNHQRV